MPSENVETTETVVSDQTTQANSVAESHAATTLASLVSDPDVQAVLAAKRAGKKISVTEEEVKEVEDPYSDVVAELEGDEQSQKLVKVVMDLMDKRTKPLDENVQALMAMAQQMQSQTVSEQIRNAEAKYEDFAEFKPEMAKLSKANPNLDLDSLYVLAKAKAGKLNLKPPSTFSERPSPTPRKAAAKSTDHIGRREFRNFLADALDRNSQE